MGTDADHSPKKDVIKNMFMQTVHLIFSLMLKRWMLFSRSFLVRAVYGCANG